MCFSYFVLGMVILKWVPGQLASDWFGLSQFQISPDVASDSTFSCAQVCSREEELLLASGSKRAEHLLQKLVEQKKPEGLESAIQHRNKLLEYDKTRQVIEHELTLSEPVRFCAYLQEFE